MTTKPFVTYADRSNRGWGEKDCDPSVYPGDTKLQIGFMDRQTRALEGIRSALEIMTKPKKQLQEGITFWSGYWQETKDKMNEEIASLRAQLKKVKASNRAMKRRRTKKKS